MSAKADLSLQASGALPSSGGSSPPLRPISFSDPKVTVDRRADGTIYLRPHQALDRISGPADRFPALLGQPLRRAPFHGGARCVTAAGARSLMPNLLSSEPSHRLQPAGARSFGRKAASLSCPATRSTMRWSSFGAMVAGVPFCPVSPAYSLISKDYGKLAYLMKLLTPGLVFVDDADQFAAALASQRSRGHRNRRLPRRAIRPRRNEAFRFAGDAAAIPVSMRHIGAIGPDTIAKFLLTSGSTGNPKAVINTQRMLCANQVMIRETMSFPEGGAAGHRRLAAVESHLWRQPQSRARAVQRRLDLSRRGKADARRHRGDRAKSAARFRRRSISTCRRVTSCCCLICATTRSLRHMFFHKLQAMFFSGAAMSPFVWKSLDELSARETGFRVPMLTGLGATESAPLSVSANAAHQPLRPYRPSGARQRDQARTAQWQARIARQGAERHAGLLASSRELTAAAFDEEGFYKFGDAAKPAVADDLFRRARLRWPHCRRFQTRQRHLGQRRPVARPFHRGLRAAGARRRDRRHQPRRNYGARRARSRWLPPDQSGAAGERHRRLRPDARVRGAFRQRFAAFQSAATGSSTRSSARY